MHNNKENFKARKLHKLTDEIFQQQAQH